MPKYNYIAKTKQGQPRTGTIEAQDEYELASILRKEGCILIKADSEGAKKGLKLRQLYFSLPFVGRVSVVERVMFTRNLRVMVSAGVSLPRSLKILSEQTKSNKFKRCLLQVREEIIKGEAFSKALSKHSDIFNEMFFNMIRVGEESGTLEKVLDALTKQMEKEYEIKSRIKGAMIYPAVIISAMIGIGILMLIIVVPKLAKLFEELQMELPLTTRIVVAIGTFLSTFWYLIPVLILVVIVLFRMILKTKSGKVAFDTIVIKMPLISPLVKKANSATTVRTLSSLISAGVPIVRSLEITSRALGNTYYREALAKASERVKKGGKLGEVLKDYGNIYPVLVIQMIAVGEETGETSTILEKLADFFEEEVANATKNISNIIEPILMLIIGAAVGFFAVSMIQPMYTMLEGIE